MPVITIRSALGLGGSGRVLTKLHLRDRTQAVVLAYECGLVAPGDVKAST